MKTKLNKIIILILLVVSVACTPQQQDTICPPSPSRLVGADVKMYTLLTIKILHLGETLMNHIL